MRFNYGDALKTGRAINILGVNSGTSGDGLDMALVRFNTGKPRALQSSSFPYSEELRERIIAAGEPAFSDGIYWLELNAELGESTGRLARKFISLVGRKRLAVDLIAMHGQTVRHLPDYHGRTLTYQIGEPTVVAKITGRPVISDFRHSDIAAGGEGAPLSPLLHEALFKDSRKWRAIVNIGGIANATLLPPRASKRNPVAGDCGPGNMLLDMAMQRLFGLPYDEDGGTALGGQASENVVRQILSDPFFVKKPPKSTGRELFGGEFLEEIMRKVDRSSNSDIIATLAEITVRSIADFIRRVSLGVSEIYLCGGGAYNKYFMMGLRKQFPGKVVETTEALGYDPRYLEAILWAFLAYRFVKQKSVSAGHFTGAKLPYIPGKLCLP